MKINDKEFYNSKLNEFDKKFIEKNNWIIFLFMKHLAMKYDYYQLLLRVEKLEGKKRISVNKMNMGGISEYNF